MQCKVRKRNNTRERASGGGSTVHPVRSPYGREFFLKQVKWLSPITAVNSVPILRSGALTSPLLPPSLTNAQMGDCNFLTTYRGTALIQTPPPKVASNQFCFPPGERDSRPPSRSSKATANSPARRGPREGRQEQRRQSGEARQLQATAANAHGGGERGPPARRRKLGPRTPTDEAGARRGDSSGLTLGRDTAAPAPATEAAAEREPQRSAHSPLGAP